jgi:hypothetical protein
MGIKGLFQFLKRYEQESSVVDAIKDRVIGVDLFWFIHHSKGDFFVFQDYMTALIQSSSRVHCVVDGAPPKGTKEERKEKRKKREQAKKELKELDRPEACMKHVEVGVEKQIQKHKEKLTLQAWYPTREYVEYVKQWLTGEGCVIHQAPVDADSELIRLEKTGWIDCIVSNDSDLLTLGANCVIRMYSPSDAGIYEVASLRQILELSPTQWIDFMNLCRQMEKKDMMTAYSFIRVYKEFDVALERYHHLYASPLKKEEASDEGLLSLKA